MRWIFFRQLHFYSHHLWKCCPQRAAAPITTKSLAFPHCHSLSLTNSRSHSSAVTAVHQPEQRLNHGHLLRWMDLVACLSAEKHAKLPCVTISVDDIFFNGSANIGHVLTLEAIVNRSFTSSLEVGVIVTSEDPFTGVQNNICNALFVFVAQPGDGGKVKLPPVAIETERENEEYLLAGERRKWRITYAKDLEQQLENITKAKTISGVDESSTSTREVLVSTTQVKTVEIVLPVHTNHHGTTFGGQIMDWMTDVATISAIRLCQSEVTLEGIQSIIFKGPSYVGERVSLKSSVTKVFSDNTFEVGIKVEGYEVGGEPRIINSAFYTFRPADSNVATPQLVYSSKAEEERAQVALARHNLWLDRQALADEKQEVAVKSENIYDVIYKSTSKVMTNYVRKQWDNIQTAGSFQLCTHERNQDLVIRLTDTLEGISAKDIFKKISAFENRAKWDPLCRDIKVVRPVSEDDCLLHLFYKTSDVNEMRKLPRDFVVLASKRYIQGKSGENIYMIAFTSVTTQDLPPSMDYHRSTILSSGYVLEDTSLSPENPSCKLTYVYQLGSSKMPFSAGDLSSVSLEKLNLYDSLKAFILS